MLEAVDALRKSVLTYTHKPYNGEYTIVDRVSTLRHSAGTQTPTCLFWVSFSRPLIMAESKLIFGRFKEMLCEVCVVL